MPNAGKVAEVKKWFAEKVTCAGEPYFLDDEQVAAVVSENKNVIVTARAGSGKTRTIVAKIVYLIARLGYKPDEIMAFVFNKDASKEINARLLKMRVDGRPVVNGKVNVAMTFHAFAYYVVFALAKNVRGAILMDTEEFAYQEKFIEDVVRTIPEEEVYEFFRECSEGRAAQTTLGGEYVKTKNEKIIADWLFEHDISYECGKKYYLNAAMQKVTDKNRGRMKDLTETLGTKFVEAEFYLPGVRKPWKHFLVDGYEGLIKRRRFNKKHGNYDEQVELLEKMRWFFSGKWGKETEFSGMVESCFEEGWTREECEYYLEILAKRCGFSHEKLAKAEIVRRTYEKNLEHLVWLMKQYIIRKEQGAKIDLSGADRKVQKFSEFGEYCYDLYCRRLTESPKFGMDFSLMLTKAKELIESRVANEFLSNKRMIMIDEYQDFSRSFLEVVQAILQVCPKARVFVVGDDWQAINRFAGSDVKYFVNFAEYFPEDCQSLTISTNYRSAVKIVDTAREFMIDNMGGVGDFRANADEPGEVVLADPGILKINADEDVEIMEVASEQVLKKYLKEVVWQIRNNLDCETIYLLHRKHRMRMGAEITRFYEMLQVVCEKMGVMEKGEFLERVKILTMHQSKGLEADLVILLEVEDGVMPALHPDAAFYMIFGEDEKTVQEDAMRLFYVAMTRARKKLVVMRRGELATAQDFVSLMKIGV